MSDGTSNHMTASEIAAQIKYDTRRQILARQVFDGPDLFEKWFSEAHPEALRGETPEQAYYRGRAADVLSLLEYLARGG